MSDPEKPCTECGDSVSIKKLYANGMCFPCIHEERKYLKDARKLTNTKKRPFGWACIGDTYKGVTIESGPPNTIYYAGHGMSVRVWKPDDVCDFMNDIDKYFLTGHYQRFQPETVTMH